MKASLWRILSETTRPTKMMILQIMLQDLDKRVFINEQKKLASSEFSWSLGVRKLDTEIAGFTLQVKWKAIIPPRSDHTNEKFEIWWPMQETMHCTSVMVVGNTAEATSCWNGCTMRGGGQAGLANVVNVIHVVEELPTSGPSPSSPLQAVNARTNLGALQVYGQHALSLL